MSAVSHAAPWYAVIDNDDHTESTPYPTARDAMNRSAAVRGEGMGAASNVCDVRQRRRGTTTATEARLAAADTLNGLSIDDRHAARMESRRLLALVSA